MDEEGTGLFGLNLILEGIAKIDDLIEAKLFPEILDVLPFGLTGIPGTEMAAEVRFHMAGAEIVLDITFVGIGDDI